ncbi:MAG: gamma-glutamyl-gamma-aminobutyrate hydrolase family protein [Chloroflexi bacterium]|nr:MAG: peptidase C26 [Dehalococcoidia bacterium]RUA19972.1 MAG: gamma-glutamyl-gamma-aminobutyrate hydrolase family protein [Chloroflexota bacterium]RUA30619.1 MAG: gamma-glutamyl-gamma-aminobutyrate hydrolase family protein [Chloroflexota bacterium]HIM62409.1 gamma-glutamyl-gamma-aminobutyrate hydrolase family protein [Dehalococcoidia bacterium]
MLCHMAIVVITSSGAKNARLYVEVMESAGAAVRVIMPEDHADVATEELMRDAGGLLLTGGPDVDPALYGEVADPEAGLELDRGLDDLELRILEYALGRDMPVLAICRGMQLLNVAFGGKLIQDLPNHKSEKLDERWESASHTIYLAPGAKAAPVIGMAGFFKVNSLHHQGLKEAQRAPRLMTTAYEVEDGLIEGLESPEHSWVIGLQCHPERQDEVPKMFDNLFIGLHERAESFISEFAA